MLHYKKCSYVIVWAILIFLITACNNKGREKNIQQPQGKGDTATVSAYIKKANEFTQTDLDSMHYYTVVAQKMSVDIHYRAGYAKAKAVESNYLRRKGDYSGAINLGLEVVNIYDSLGMWKDVVRLKNLIADFYKEMGGEKGTIEYLEKGIQLSKEGQAVAEKEKYDLGVILSLNQQAITWRDLSHFTKNAALMDTAFNLYQKGLNLINQSGEGVAELGKFYNNISQVYREHFKNFPKALEYLYKAVDFNASRNNQHSLTYNYAALSAVYLNMKRNDSAKYYAEKMLDLCRELKSPTRLVNAYTALSDFHKQAGQYDSALYYRELGISLVDSLNNVKRAGLIAESQTKYETGKKEERITQLGKMNAVKTERLWLAFGLMALFVLLIAMFIFQNQRLQKQKAQITEQSNRVQWMMKELHHRVKNNLQIVSSLLNLQTYRLKDEESVTALKESQLRVQAMSLIHQRLYTVEDVSLVNFKLYLNDLVETLMKSYGNNADDFDLQIKIDKEFLDVDTVMPMGLLVNEIITNSFKYAYKDVKRPLLHISLASGNKQLLLDIKDNGPGINTVSTEQNNQGFGKKLIAALSKQLKATYLVDSSAGTVYHFIIPDNKEKAA